MKKRLITLGLIVGISFTSAAYANWFKDIINAINEQGNLTNAFLKAMNADQIAMLTAEQDIDSLMKQVSGHLAGSSGWGTYNIKDYQSYGHGGENWSDLMQMAKNEGGDSGLGKTMRVIAKQFPSDLNTIKQVISDPLTTSYYTAQSEAIVATRAASQFDFNRVQEQIAYQQMLREQIEKTTNIKAAMDLSNRIQVEGNLIQLAMLRQLTLANQQQALTAQAEMNAALVNANFLKK